MTGITDPNEKRIAEAIISEALKRGYAISVFDGGCFVLRASSQPGHILDAMGRTGQDRLHFMLDGESCGWVDLVWGNGCDLISNCTCNSVTENILELAELIQEDLAMIEEAKGHEVELPEVDHEGFLPTDSITVLIASGAPGTFAAAKTIRRVIAEALKAAGFEVKS